MDVEAEEIKGEGLLEHISDKGLSPAFSRLNMVNDSASCMDCQVMSAQHSRSKSATDNKMDSTNWDILVAKAGKAAREASGKPLHPNANIKARLLPPSERRAALEQDVEQLQMRLEYEKSMRYTLEKAMGRASSALSPGHHHFAAQTRDLLTEIAILEEEVTNREQHVLSLYRNIFDQCISGASSTQNSNRASPAHVKHEDKNLPSTISKALCTPSKFVYPQHRRQFSVSTQCSQNTNTQLQSKMIHSSVLSGPLTIDERIQGLHQPSKDIASEQAVRHVNPDVDIDEKECEVVSLKNQKNEVHRTLKDYIYESPSRLSEELVRCMAEIYCKLSDPPIVQSGMILSPSSSISSTSLFSPRDAISDGWSPRWRTHSVSETILKNPFKIKGETGNTGAYSSMVEVPWICADKDQLAYATSMLQTFRSMVEHLERVDPSQMQRESKLAFWINVYNALVMHAYLAYGIPRSSLKKMPLFQRAAYKIGGHSISANTIEHSILSFRTYRPAQWLETLLSTGARIKAGDERRTFGRKYGLDDPEPLVLFALCRGGHSDPAVRIYTAKNVYDELETAKREFLQASIGIQNHRRVFLPRILERYAKEASITSANLLHWVSENVDKQLKTAINKCIERKPQAKSAQCIEWLQYNGGFRYIFVRDLTPGLV
ncbi:uncharacterized protein LOC131069822 isoform X2 [Cryptomeria japonica]|uniref:uncharacterized protein LOC131069822 isoform X2 n=1 Tax=Cryptomeria japonica TaxID=3369 RepID=UPI0025ACB756|nr:uncharacterized protein LOC131069822 isoform X2 [Cryptomeria japonica]